MKKIFNLSFLLLLNLILINNSYSYEESSQDNTINIIINNKLFDLDKNII